MVIVEEEGTDGGWGGGGDGEKRLGGRATSRLPAPLAMIYLQSIESEWQEGNFAGVAVSRRQCADRNTEQPIMDRQRRTSTEAASAASASASFSTTTIDKSSSVLSRRLCVCKLVMLQLLFVGTWPVAPSDACLLLSLAEYSLSVGLLMAVATVFSSTTPSTVSSASALLKAAG